MDEDHFWEGFSLALAKEYDLSEVRTVTIGGDEGLLYRLVHNIKKTYAGILTEGVNWIT
jgi:hypothetical protein